MDNFRFYPSKTQDTRNYGKLFFPEQLTGTVMLNPVYSAVTVQTNTKVLVDSGAFQDLTKIRLTPKQALDRQLKHIGKVSVKSNFQVTPEAICIYDQMAGVDEIIIDGRKAKVRGTEETAKYAIEETLQSAAYYAQERRNIPGKIMFVGQGVTPDQYMYCVEQMAQYMAPDDYFAFGGFCIIGRHRKKMLPIFYETFARVVAYLKPRGITRFHTLGVCVPEAITYAVSVARGEGVVFSTDSSAPEVASLLHGAVYVGGRVKYGTWTKAQKGIDYCPVDLAHSNISAYANWINAL